MTTPRQPDLTDGFNELLERLRQGMHTGLPARVTAYDPVTQTISAQPQVRQAHEDEEGDRVAAALPIIPNIPVEFPGGAGFRVTWPIAVGDPVWLSFSEVSLDRWLTQGRLVDPGDDHRFHLTDAVGRFGIRARPEVWTSAPIDRMTIGYDTGAQVHIYPGEIRIGTNDPAELEPAALGERLNTFIAAQRTWNAAHVHPAPGGATSPTSTSGPAAVDVRSSAVKVQK